MRINYGDDRTHVIRLMDSLGRQIESDFDELTSLIKRIEKNVHSISKIEEALGKISWIKQELRMFEQLNIKNIEGVLCNESVNIERYIMQIEPKLKILRLAGLKTNSRK